MRGCPGLWLTSIIVLVVVAFIGWTRIASPFTEDQTFFMIGAQQQSKGDVLYRDFWDIKQPGIFWFYLVAGSLFGFTEAGLFTFEMVYLLGFSVFLIWSLARYFYNPIVAACLPLFTVACYYCVAGPWERGQLEAEVGIPMFLALWLALRAEESGSLSSWFLFFSGMCGGIVVLFKSLFLMILLVIWLPTIYFGNKKCPAPGIGPMSRALLVLGCGFAVPLLMTAAYFAMNQSLEVLLWTTFVWPRRVVAALGHTSLQQLIDGHRYFLWAFGPSLALASINFVPGVSRRVDPLNRDLLLWVICGLAVIQVQVRSWYSWHYLMLMVPLGILAARCVDSLWHYAAEQYGQQHRWRLAFHLTLAVLFLYLGHVYKLTIDTALLVRQGLPTTLAKIGEIRKNSSNAYARIANEVSFFAEAPARPGGVYVFCGASHQHLYSLLSGREPMVIYATSSPLVLPEKQDWLLERLRCSRPGYILVPRENQPFVDQEFPAFQSFLGSYYRPYRESAAGIWYISLE